MTTQDDSWLDSLLADPPRVHERHFTERTLAYINAYQRRRRIVLISAWVAAIAIVLLTSPWNNIADWMQVWTLGDSGLLQGFSLSTDDYDREQLINLAREHWLIPVAFICIAAVLIKNTFLQEV